MILRLYCCLIFIIIVFDINTAHASAWLLEQGRYRYIVGGNKTNKISKTEKKQREETVLHINNRIIYLRQHLEEVKNQPNLQAKILRQIKKLEQKILKLLSYQDEQFANICIEYGITDNQNIGMNFLHKNDKFINKKNTSLEAAIYYKFKLFGDHDFVISA